jgi:hypothetical protein
VLDSVQGQIAQAQREAQRGIENAVAHGERLRLKSGATASAHRPPVLSITERSPLLRSMVRSLVR